MFSLIAKYLLKESGNRIEAELVLYEEEKRLPQLGMYFGAVFFLCLFSFLHLLFCPGSQKVLDVFPFKEDQDKTFASWRWRFCGVRSKKPDQN